VSAVAVGKPSPAHVEKAAPVGGPFLTRATLPFLALALLGFALIAYRFAFGLGRATALSDGYPWGIWIAFDVVTGTALACGGYAVALLVYILNRGKYHPIIRPAILTSALGYSIAGLSVMIDVGRPWYAWRLPLPWNWNLNSALLEVALCIMTYTVVLWIELAPAFLEGWADSKLPVLRKVSAALTPLLEKSLVWIIALGMVLPTMHQSSLGTLMLLTGPKLHPLWSTGLLPLLFLIGCIAMGYAAVVFEGSLSSLLLGRKPETEMLAGLGRVMTFVLGAFLVIRLADVAMRGVFSLALVPDLYAAMFWIELALLAAPLVMLWSEEGRRSPRNLFRAAMLMMLAGGLYRFDTYLVAFRPGSNWSYFPSVPEQLITIGLVATEVLAFVYLVKRFPILSAQHD
jgi:Ni/Fe-hydrogenase subunit HybB-like protein